MTFQERALEAARNLRRKSLVSIVIAGVALFALPTLAALYPVRHIVLLGISAASGLATIALGGLVLFDAVLFKEMASYPDENTAGRAIDGLLARTGLKKLPAAGTGANAVRPLEARIQGAASHARNQSILAAISFLVGMAAFGWTG